MKMVSWKLMILLELNNNEIFHMCTIFFISNIALICINKQSWISDGNLSERMER